MSIKRIEILKAARKIIIEKAQIAHEAALARDDAIKLLMAALDVPPDWRIAPDASAFVAPPDKAQEEGNADPAE